MAKVKDPVCGMMIDAEAAAGQSTTSGRTYYFCSTQCRQRFDANPNEYAASAAADVGVSDTSEVHERNLTMKGGTTAPRFGSAGSGGLEFEGPPGTTGIR
jgi:YHS domain-containing protein